MMRFLNSSVVFFCVMLAVACSSTEHDRAAANKNTRAAEVGANSDEHTSTEVQVGSDTIVIKAMKFIPEHTTVNKGDLVIFINKDMVAHDVTEIDSLWQSPKIEANQTWQMVAKESVDYFCSIHLVMKGSITVK